MSKSKYKRIIISRTDAIGDVILTLPLAGIIKKHYPETKVIFFGRSYTAPIINTSEDVDEFINYDDFEKAAEKEQADFLKKVKADAIVHVFPRKNVARAAAKAGIAYRIGTTNRLYHWGTCNELIALGRKNSDLHEAQLNIRLLTKLGINAQMELSEIPAYYHLTNIPNLPEGLASLTDTSKFKLIIHPKSNVSAREWSLEHYKKLIALCNPDEVSVFITGTDKEKALLQDWLPSLPAHVHDMTGKMKLEELIAFIAHCDGLVAASTGPLHIAAALGKCAIGIYPPIRPMHPGRWAPVGLKASYLCVEKNCVACKDKPQQCSCMQEITTEQVFERIPLKHE